MSLLEIDKMFADDGLPDDITLWPTDPSTLLGLASDATRRDLKRAYTRLIRRYKPENFPEHFRRLRQAYEILDEQFEWQVSLAESDPEVINFSALEDDISPSIQSPPSIEELDRGDFVETDISECATPRQRAAPTDADQLWQQLLDGEDSSSTYVKLREMNSQQPLSEVGYKRLYWMLTIDPGLDHDRDPCSWLIEAFRQHGLSPRLEAILSVEVRRRVGDVPEMLGGGLLDRIQSTSELVGFAELRWRVARRLCRFDVIKMDIERLKRQFLDEPVEWASLLRAAVCQLVLVHSDSATEVLLNVRWELEHTPNTFEFNWLWGWYDTTVTLHDSWILSRRANDNDKVFSTIHYTDHYGHPLTLPHGAIFQTLATLQRLLKLVANTWDGSPSQVRSGIQSFCFDLAKVPQESLDDLKIINQLAGPLLLQLLHLIKGQLSDSEDDFKITEAAKRDMEVFVFRRLWTYRRWELTVLNFCMKAAVTPDDVAATLEQFADQLPDCIHELSRSIKIHLPLQCLVLAQRIVWST